MCIEIIPNRESCIVLETNVVGQNHLLLAKMNCNTKVVAEVVIHIIRHARLETW